MVRTYTKYESSNTFACVASATSNAVWTPDESSTTTKKSTGAGRAYVSANDEVLCWDVKKGELLSRWRDKACNAEVTAISQSRTDPDIFAVGYADGSIRLWDSRIATVIINFDGHRSAITTLAFDSQGIRLASGSRDTDIIVWDLVTEAGLFKLRGHKDQITGLHFIQQPSNAAEDGEEVLEPVASDAFLLSTSKDALVKIWDVEAQYCVETHVTQSNGECWSLGVSPDGSGCITAGNDGEFKIWSISGSALRHLSSKMANDEQQRVLHERGTLYRQGKDRTIGVNFHPKADFIALYGAEKAVELWRIRTPAEIQRALARKRRRRREKAAEKAATEETAEDVDMVDGEEIIDVASAPVSEVFVPYIIVRTGGKVRSMDWAGGRPNKAIQMLVSTTNNQVELYNVSVQDKAKKSKAEEATDYSRSFAVDLPGHRTDVRSLALSSDDRMLATASSGSLKIWNVRTGSCLRTLECGYALCCSFLPGDKVVIIGNKAGELELFDIASSTLIDTIKAHDGAIWTLQVHPSGTSVVTGSADKTAKFWDFTVIQESIPGTKRTTPRLTLTHTRTLKLTDDILSLSFTPDSRLLALSTLDNTIKVFFTDSLKLFLTLYGHKLPVLSLSISSDSKLLASSSADKNLRIWGLDFGDCHKSFFAHDDSIMCCSFIPHPINAREEGHLVFTAAKDGLLKTWDATKFEHIQRLRGHHGEIWALAVSRTGEFVVTASHDKSVRIWRQSDEPLFLEEERERELEETYDRNLTTSLEKDQSDEYAVLDANGQNGDATAVVSASKQTPATLTAGEKITEALALATEDLAIVRAHEGRLASLPKDTPLAPPQRHPLLSMRNISAEKHLLSVFAAIPAPQLHDALLLLSASLLPDLFVFVQIWLQREMNVPLACRIFFFLLKTHQAGIVAGDAKMRGQLEAIQKVMRKVLEEQKTRLGWNGAACRVLGERVMAGSGLYIEDEEVKKGDAGKAEKKGKGKKRAFVNVA
jgi:U3 small nucleolar RNA-associated protein 12